MGPEPCDKLGAWHLENASHDVAALMVYAQAHLEMDVCWALVRAALKNGTTEFITETFLTYSDGDVQSWLRGTARWQLHVTDGENWKLRLVERPI